MFHSAGSLLIAKLVNNDGNAAPSQKVTLTHGVTAAAAPRREEQPHYISWSMKWNRCLPADRKVGDKIIIFHTCVCLPQSGKLGSRWYYTLGN